MGRGHRGRVPPRPGQPRALRPPRADHLHRRRPRDLPGPAVLARPPGRGAGVGLRRRGPGQGRRDLRLRRDARPRGDRPVADPPGERLDRRADALPPGRGRLHPGGPARRHRLRRAEQHLADLRVRGDPQAVPPAGAGPQPRRRGARRPARADNPHIAPLLGHIEIDDPADPGARRRRSRCCRRSCPTRATAGGWRRPASATSTPRATCTPTRWVATSPPRASGSGQRPPRCTPTWRRCCPPSRPTPPGTPHWPSR